MAQMTEHVAQPAAKTTPKDAHVMASFLRDMGIEEYEPRLINEMLEFMYKYVTDLLADAQLYSAHAKKKNIDADDVRLAITLQNERNIISVPDKDLTSELARLRNSNPLNAIKSSAGLRLPPERFCTIGCNYRTKSLSKKMKTVHAVSRLNIGSLQQNSNFQVTKGNPISNLSKVNIQPTLVGTIPSTMPNSIINMPASQNLMLTMKDDVKLPMTDTVLAKVKIEDDDYDMQ